MAMRFDTLVAEVLSCPASVRLVAVDGPGGAGKSASARTGFHDVQRVAPAAPTDEFASGDEPLAWWPRLLAQVI